LHWAIMTIKGTSLDSCITKDAGLLWNSNSKRNSVRNCIRVISLLTVLLLYSIYYKIL
jgi:hypothetical protein